MLNLAKTALRISDVIIAVPSSPHTRKDQTCSVDYHHYLRRRKPFSDCIGMAAIVLLGIEESLFTACFGKAEEWNCNLEFLPENCSSSTLAGALSNPGLLYLVIQDHQSGHWSAIKTFYKMVVRWHTLEFMANSRPLPG